MIQRFETALHAQQPAEALRWLILELACEGYQPPEILELFEHARTHIVNENTEITDDLLIDMMDTIVGWCSPVVKLFPDFD